MFSTWNSSICSPLCLHLFYMEQLNISSFVFDSFRHGTVQIWSPLCLNLFYMEQLDLFSPAFESRLFGSTKWLYTQNICVSFEDRDGTSNIVLFIAMMIPRFPPYQRDSRKTIFGIQKYPTLVVRNATPCCLAVLTRVVRHKGININRMSTETCKFHRIRHKLAQS